MGDFLILLLAYWCRLRPLSRMDSAHLFRIYQEINRHLLCRLQSNSSEGTVAFFRRRISSPIFTRAWTSCIFWGLWVFDLCADLFAWFCASAFSHVFFWGFRFNWFHASKSHMHRFSSNFVSWRTAIASACKVSIWYQSWLWCVICQILPTFWFTWFTA